MYGKWYARLKSIETLSMTKLAKHISEHGSVFTEDVAEGVMKKFKTCLLEMLLESKKVKAARLATTRVAARPAAVTTAAAATTVVASTWGRTGKGRPSGRSFLVCRTFSSYGKSGECES